MAFKGCDENPNPGVEMLTISELTQAISWVETELKQFESNRENLVNILTHWPDERGIFTYYRFYSDLKAIKTRIAYAERYLTVLRAELAYVTAVETNEEDEK